MNRANRKGIEKCVIITGMSGGGKSSALRVLEDQGLYAVDNLPPALLPRLLGVLGGHGRAAERGVTAVIDGRSGGLLWELRPAIERLKKKAGNVLVIFLDATDETLVRRFETTRRNHPLAADTTILGSITAERELIAPIREDADIIIDTTDMTMPELKARLTSIVGISAEGASVILSSFGFKYGLPQDADYVIDVRFLPNPNYVEELHPLSGADPEIQRYLGAVEYFGEFLDKTEQLLEFILSVYGSTGKKQFHVAIGCTGGRHRSVAVAEMLAERLRACGGTVSAVHRDIDKGSPR